MSGVQDIIRECSRSQCAGTEYEGHIRAVRPQERRLENGSMVKPCQNVVIHDDFYLLTWIS